MNKNILNNGQIRPLAVAVIRKNNKVLANKRYDEKKKEYFYRLPGGEIEFCETAEQAVCRELKEEIGLDIKIIRKLGVVENIFEFNGKKGHEIIIIFEATLPAKINKKINLPELRLSIQENIQNLLK